MATVNISATAAQPGDDVYSRRALLNHGYRRVAVVVGGRRPVPYYVHCEGGGGLDVFDAAFCWGVRRGRGPWGVLRGRVLVYTSAGASSTVRGL